MNEYQKMLAGELFDGSDGEIAQLRDRAFLQLKAINDLGTALDAVPLFAKLLQLGQDSYIMPPFRCEFGRHIAIGEHTFINMGAIMLDGAKITIGNHVLIGPNCQLYTPSHSLDHRSRRQWQTICRPITIEDDVWLGGNVVVNQGVTIGARSVIAANALVTEDVAPDSLMVGVPAKKLRSLQPGEAGKFPLFEGD